jgi:hypothetical protein
MPEIHERSRLLRLRLVYFGPPRSGKAKNLQRIFDLLRPENRSRMTAVDAGADRRISFDILLPGEGLGWSVQISITGCSSPLLKPTKQATLEACDAIAFIADASRDRREENHEAFREAEEYLRGPGGRRLVPPVVLQVNKRDRADAISEDEIEREWGARSWPIFTAAAKQGDGVRETFTCLLRLAFETADKAGGLEAKTGLSLAGVTASAVKALRRGEAA